MFNDIAVVVQCKQFTRHFIKMIVFLFILSLAANAAYGKSVTLNLKKADIKAVIATVAEATGKNFIVDPRVRGKVTVISSKSLDKNQLYQLFLAILEFCRHSN